MKFISIQEAPLRLRSSRALLRGGCFFFKINFPSGHLFAPVMIFLPSLILDSHPSFNQYIRKALSIDKYIRRDSGIFPPLHGLEAYPLRIFLNISNHFPGLLSILFSLLTLSPDFWRVNAV